jgi:AAA domain
MQDHLRCSQQNAASGTPASPPLHWFITGGAGVGKSFVMNLVRELIIRACGADVNAVKMTAPTGEASPHTSTCHFICYSSLAPLLTLMCVSAGVAAFNISGVTLHQALKLPV